MDYKKAYSELLWLRVQTAGSMIPLLTYHTPIVEMTDHQRKYWALFQSLNKSRPLAKYTEVDGVTIYID